MQAVCILLLYSLLFVALVTRVTHLLKNKPYTGKAAGLVKSACMQCKRKLSSVKARCHVHAAQEAYPDAFACFLLMRLARHRAGLKSTSLALFTADYKISHKVLRLQVKVPTNTAAAQPCPLEHACSSAHLPCFCLLVHMPLNSSCWQPSSSVTSLQTRTRGMVMLSSILCMVFLWWIFPSSCWGYMQTWLGFLPWQVNASAWTSGACKHRGRCA